MPKKTKILNNQNLIDLSIQENGGVEALFDLALINNLSITSELDTANEIKVPALIVNNEVYNYFNRRKAKPASGNVYIPIDEPEFCAPSTITLNGSSFLSINSGESQNVTLVDEDGATVTPVSVTGSEIEIAKGDSGWKRNPDFLKFPINTDKNKAIFYGLFLVFEGEHNALRVRFGGNPTVNWGDGTTGTITQDTTKVYNYNNIVASVNQYYDGRNYKQCLVSIENFDANALILSLIDTANNINTKSSLNFADIYLSYAEFNSNTRIRFNNERTLPYLEQICLENISSAGFTEIMKATNLHKMDFNNVIQLRRLTLSQSYLKAKYTPPSLSTSFEDCTDFICENVGNLKYIVSGSENTMDRMLLNCRFKKIDSIEVDRGISFSGRNFLNNAYLLEEVGLIKANLNNFENAFKSCVNLRKIIFENCSNVNNTNDIFNSTGSIHTLVMPNLTRGVDVSNNSMTKATIDAFFNSIGNANGSQSINIRNNPGALTADRSIATNKGYTVIFN